jgi:hypothetical protein
MDDAESAKKLSLIAQTVNKANEVARRSHEGCGKRWSCCLYSMWTAVIENARHEVSCSARKKKVKIKSSTV